MGPRQVGKTTLLRQAIDDLLDGGWSAPNLTYFDFSDPRVSEPVMPGQVADVRPLGIRDDLPRILLLDEIRSAPRWDRWLKQAVDRGGLRVVATDSASSLLRNGSRESGQGRWDEFLVEGLSFTEFVSLSRPGEALATALIRAPALFRRYLALGGFPEHVRSESFPEVRERVRMDVVDRAIMRDLAGKVDHPGRVKDLFVYLVQESGGLFNARARSQDLHGEADPRTVSRWVELLEETMLVWSLPAYSVWPAARLRSRRKLYAADHGLVRAFAESPTHDLTVPGRVYEAVVYRHLRDLARRLHGEVFFLRTKNELEADFILRAGDRLIAIEVTQSPRPKREKLARLRAAADHVSASRRLLVYGGQAGEESEGTPMVPLRQFLLDPAAVVLGGA
jgi:predicted AAA+ superfamily ATPase